jgi:glycosyltransferase involved in cell wall biosynthesis
MEIITIGIPCYNAEATIERAIHSALNQDWTNIEVIVVDDASTDSSLKIINRLLNTHPKLRLLKKDKNVGVGAIRKTIVEEANGVFVAFFDDDDESATSRVRAQRDRILTYEKAVSAELVACYASGERYYPNGYFREIQAIGSKQVIPVGDSVAKYLLFNGRKASLFYGGGTPASALMARKSMLIKVGNFDSSFRRVEDSELAIRVALAGGHFIGCPEKLYTQFATKGSDKSAEKNFNAEKQIFEKHKSFLIKERRYDYSINWFEFRYYNFNGQRLKAIGALFKCWIGNPLTLTNHFLRSAPRRFIHERRMGSFRRKN